MTFSIIQKSQLEGANRLDAEYYQLEYFIDFKKGDWQPIGNFLNLCQYGISQSMNEEKLGFPILKMNDIDDAFLVDDSVKYVDLQESLFPQYKLEINDVLFNRVNAENFVGRTGIFKLNKTMVFASYLIRLRLENNSEILPDYLNIFLNSSFGIKQIRKWMRRAVNQANVNAEELKQIKIAVLPRPTQELIKDLSENSWQQIKLSKKFYHEAENLLLEELELKDFEPREDLSFLVNYYDVKKANRIDADYFQPKYAELIKNLKTKTTKLFPEIIENVPAIFNPKPDDNYKYVELSNINSSIGIIDGFSEILGKEAPGRAKRILKQGDVIVSSVEGSLGKVALVDKEQEGYLASTGFFQFKSKEILPEVLLVLAKSFIFKMQLQKETAGTILTAVPKEAINNILIPVLSKSTQEKIADLVKKSHEARKKSKELLEEAKRKVEEMLKVPTCRGGAERRPVSWPVSPVTQAIKKEK